MRVVCAGAVFAIAGVFEPFSWTVKACIVRLAGGLSSNTFFLVSVGLHTLNVVLLSVLVETFVTVLMGYKLSTRRHDVRVARFVPTAFLSLWEHDGQCLTGVRHDHNAVG